MTTHVHAMPFGATVLPGGGVHFRLWAPAEVAIALEIDGARHEATETDEGWREAKAAWNAQVESET